GGEGMAGENRDKRQRLFELYSKNFSLYESDHQSIFVCPLCRRKYDHLALEGTDPGVSLAHVISEKLGGSLCTLTCTACNNDNGSAIEAALKERFVAEDFMAGVGEQNGRMSGGFGSVGVDIQFSPHKKSWTLIGVQPQTNPAHMKALKEYLNTVGQKGKQDLT